MAMRREWFVIGLSCAVVLSMMSLPVGAGTAAAKSGTVSFISEGLRGWGKILILDHEDGFMSVYCGVSEIAVRRGEAVNRGQTIARIAASSKNPGRLHFEIRKGHVPQNPLSHLS